MNTREIIDIVQRQELYENSDAFVLTEALATPKKGSVSSSEKKKVKKTKAKKKNQVVVTSTKLLEEPRRSSTFTTNTTTNSNSSSINKPSTTTPTTSFKRDTKKNKTKRVEVQQYQPEVRLSRSNSHTTSTSERPIELLTEVSGHQTKKYSARKPELNTVKNIHSYQTSSTSRRKPIKEPIATVPSQQLEQQHHRRIERSQRPNTNPSTRYIQLSKAFSGPNSRKKSSPQHQPEQPGSDKSTSSSRSSSSRLRFDGAVESSNLTTSEKKSSKRNLDSVSKLEQQRSVIGTDRLRRSSKSNTTVDNTSNSRSSQRFDTPIQSSTSINRNHCQHNANKNMSANISSTCENIEMAHEKSETACIYTGDEESERILSADVADGKVQSSCCTTRKKIIFGVIICCAIIALSVIVPYSLLLGDSSGGKSNDFPKLSKAERSTVVTSISTDICNESVPKSGACTPIAFNEEQGGELCNLVAKSMINTTVYGDIALINAGICKQTLLAPELTVGSIEDAIAAENLMVVEISGVDVVNILTQALTTTFGEPGNAQAYPYAAGLRYNVEANLSPSERLSNIEVNRGLRDDTWERIDIRRFYKVITTELLANGGMGYVSFEKVIDDWKDPLHIKTGDAFYNYAMKNINDTEWSVLPNSEYSTQYFIGENEEPAIAVVPTRICHALLPGQPESSFCTAADVVHGGEVCNLVSWAIYDQNFGVDMVVLKGDSCAGDIEVGDFLGSSFDTILSEDQSLFTVDLLGSEIVTMIDDRVSSAVDNGVVGNYPYAAGLKFDVSTISSPKVSNINVLTSSGSWTPIVGTETYTVATTSDLANSSSAQDMGTTMKEEIISYAADWKTLYKPSADKASTQSYA